MWDLGCSNCTDSKLSSMNSHWLHFSKQSGQSMTLIAQRCSKSSCKPLNTAFEMTIQGTIGTCTWIVMQPRWFCCLGVSRTGLYLMVLAGESLAASQPPQKLHLAARVPQGEFPSEL